MKNPDVIIIGAGAAGLMCAIEAGKRGRRVLIIDHANKVGKKILMSGGGRCNFTNYFIEPQHYLSANPHFCKSALKRYSSYDFIALVKKHNIPFHEKSHGQLFCDNKASDIVGMLLACCSTANVTISLNTSIKQVENTEKGFSLSLSTGERVVSQSLVVATGGLSIPTMGASPYGYQLATQFGLTVLPTRAGLVPFTLQPDDKERLSILSGISLPCQVNCNDQNFTLDMLFTHRGLSGPAMLQISSYWHPGEPLVIDFDVNDEWALSLAKRKRSNPKTRLKQCLEEALPKRVVATFFEEELLESELQTFSDKHLQQIGETLKQWRIKPNGTEGYRTAEVTLGGVDTRAISSQTMQVNHIPGLYFIGEVLDVTGWLGGYNFQWAWSSGWAAGQVA
ncbi:BaiN/RdsA family NAD(P)/FAD-dependent oxidoreductase [Legionella hackeliae]|uniref:Putative oxidoreductase with FAD/NAD(P)-binding domain n=1 Tax=Legionella hackeliae TaxID=449 RepID=A0A0A8UY91_LEGHA|nr:NAD(P)/FAD-dependent oxidoreductase [Legionella hackeliae]KTD12671.1 flavoprotein [Legionella hackeliae]CEK12087.1 putative oxidoreductase with FAD/NAD(P)-binding domain [Legionella hackeliae]STX48876.1 flavoprotein [Legionella hackeliae]